MAHSTVWLKKMDKKALKCGNSLPPAGYVELQMESYTQWILSQR